jgi:RNA polymerase sigma-70 factor (ECF subfamily)
MVNSLEPEFRSPFQMHDSGYKYQEIADELGLHLGTVKSRIHFSRQKLIEKLKK